MRHMPREKGFSLLMIVLIFVVVAAAGVGAAFFAAKIKTIASERRTNTRMMAIQEAARKYYRGHPDTGLPGSPDTEIPVPTEATALNLSQAYRQDAWGKPFIYYVAPTLLPPAPAGFPNIVGVIVDTTGDSVANGQPAAGYILSTGQNQNKESSLVGGVITTAGDDILLPINVQAEAIEITVAELVVLSQKSCAFIKANLCGTPLGDLVTIYSLNDTYRRDSWGIDYRPAANNNFSSDGPNRLAGDSDDLVGPPVNTTECPCIVPPPPPPISGFDFDPADFTYTFLGLIAEVASSVGGPPGYSLDFFSFGLSAHNSGGADGGGYISFDPFLINSGLRVNQDIRPSVVPKLTVSVWIRPDVAGGNHAVFSTDTNATAQFERLIRQSGGNYSISGGFNGNYSDGPVTTGTWHHLSVVYDQTVPNVILYLDGVAVIGPSAANMPNNQVFQFGNFVYFIGVRGPIGMFFGTQWIFNGDIDEFRIYPDALSAAQINVLFHEFD